MIWKSELILALLWIAMAAWHKRLIKLNQPIKHGWWAVLSGAAIAAGTCWACPSLRGWVLPDFVMAQGCSRLVVFNVALNLFRGLSWEYSSPSTTSILDQLERRLFGGRVWLLEVLLAGVFFILQLLIL